MNKVYFASAEVRKLSWEASLPVKLEKILDRLDFASELQGKRVCIKMHLGARAGYSTIHPVFVRRVVSFIKAAGGNPFITDNPRAVETAYERGYTQETLGCPILPVAGGGDTYYRTCPVSFKNLTELKLAGELMDSDYLVCLSHAKGHGCSGYGGAIKNIAIGALVGESRGAMHMVQHADGYWDAEKCTYYTDGCEECITFCRRNTMRFADDQKLHVGFHECDFCLECNEVCPTGALSINRGIADDFQKAMAVSTEEVLKGFPNESAVYINLAIGVTAFCDCMGMTSPSLVPDIGIFASKDIVAVEKATLDSIDYRKLIPGSMIGDMPFVEREGHLFAKVHGIDPYVQVRACEERGLGSSRFELHEVE